MAEVKLSEFRGYPKDVYTLIKTKSFTKECGEGFEGSRVDYTKTYTSNISESHLSSLIENDSLNFNNEGQALANAEGTCTISRATIVDPPLAIQAVDATNIYIAGLDPFTKTEFSSSDPLPTDRYLKNVYLNKFTFMSDFPHVNTNILRERGAVINESGVPIDKHRITTYDSGVHSYKSSLTSKDVNISLPEGYSGDLVMDSIGFSSGDFFSYNIADRDYMDTTVSAIVAASGAAIFTTAAIVGFAGIVAAGPFAVAILIFTVIKLLKGESGWKTPAIRFQWVDRDSNKSQILNNIIVPEDNGTWQTYQTSIIDSFYDDVANKIYTFIANNNEGKRTRSGRAITSMSFNHGTDSTPVASSFAYELSWGFNNYKTGMVIPINTNTRSGFLWGQDNAGSIPPSWGVKVFRGSSIATPSNSIINVNWSNNKVMTRTIKDSTNPDVCYIWLYRNDPDLYINRVVSYNGSTNSWSLVRKSDIL